MKLTSELEISDESSNEPQEMSSVFTAYDLTLRERERKRGSCPFIGNGNRRVTLRENEIKDLTLGERKIRGWVRHLYLSLS